MTGGGLVTFGAVDDGRPRTGGASLASRQLDADHRHVNRYADDAPAALGRDLFFDTRLSGNGKVLSPASAGVATGFGRKPLADHIVAAHGTCP